MVLIQHARQPISEFSLWFLWTVSWRACAQFYYHRVSALSSVSLGLVIEFGSGLLLNM